MGRRSAIFVRGCVKPYHIHTYTIQAYLFGPHRIEIYLLLCRPGSGRWSGWWSRSRHILAFIRNTNIRICWTRSSINLIYLHHQIPSSISPIRNPRQLPLSNISLKETMRIFITIPILYLVYCYGITCLLTITVGATGIIEPNEPISSSTGFHFDNYGVVVWVVIGVSYTDELARPCLVAVRARVKGLNLIARVPAAK